MLTQGRTSLGRASGCYRTAGAFLCNDLNFTLFGPYLQIFYVLATIKDHKMYCGRRRMELPAAKWTRELRGMTQPELAEASGVSLKTIVNVEGRHSVRPTTARKLAEALDVSVPVLAGVEQFPATPLAQAPGAGLQLEAMYVADADARHRALEAATDEQRAAYVTELDRALERTERALLEDAAEAASAFDADERHALLGRRNVLRRYMGRLVALRDEATGERTAPPTLEQANEALRA